MPPMSLVSLEKNRGLVRWAFGHQMRDMQHAVNGVALTREGWLQGTAIVASWPPIARISAGELPQSGVCDPDGGADEYSVETKSHLRASCVSGHSVQCTPGVA